MSEKAKKDSKQWGFLKKFYLCSYSYHSCTIFKPARIRGSAMGDIIRLDHRGAWSLQNLNAIFTRRIHLLAMKISKATRGAYLDKQWLSVSQVCEFLGISKSTFYKWRQMGLAPESRRLPNGDLRVREDWLVEFLMALPEGI